ncbi:MAG: hypothetical protein DMF81_00650 [Acidobacteria bacterium]|nr:MAG: hypothetical protein DMF81_00650 [Acidobacteriota bacterium]
MTAGETAVGFLFILLVPLVLVGGGLVTLFAVGALFDALENPGELRSRIEGAFRRPPREPKAPGPDHYYRPHWQSEKKPS